ncbi:unnamed protein product, partial [Callosobruchus maculatus]
QGPFYPTGLPVSCPVGLFEFTKLLGVQINFETLLYNYFNVHDHYFIILISIFAGMYK